MKPEDRIVAYLFSNKSSVEYSTLDMVVLKIKTSLFFGISPLPDADIRAVVAKWAAFNAPGLILRPGSFDVPGGAADPAAPASTPDSELVEAVKKAVQTVNDGVTIGKKGANINIGVSGPTINLRKNDETGVSLGISWTGTLKLDAESGPFHVSGTLSKDKWEVVLSYPQDTYIPNLATVGKVFSEGEKAVGKIAAATKDLNSISDVGKVGALIKPSVSAVQDAVEAVSGIAKANPKGGTSFGFKFGSPDPLPGQQGIPGGVQGQVVWTYVF